MVEFEANLAMAGYQDSKPVPRMISYLLDILVAYVNANAQRHCSAALAARVGYLFS